MQMSFFKILMGLIFTVGLILGGFLFWDKERHACPEGYLLINANSDLGISEFCVMKFEAKRGEFDLPVSKPESKPWVNIGLKEAQHRCQELGSSYDLISNPEWMAVAREIEKNPRNWTSNKVGVGEIYRGHSDGVPFDILSVINVNDYYDQTQNSPRDGLNQRRVHYLSSGKKIWDFSGNTWSWVNWKKSLNTKIGPQNCINGSYEFNQIDHDVCSLEDLDELRNQNLLPKNSSLNSENGIGKFMGSFGSSGGAARRGGHRSDGENAGIYALSLSYPLESRLSYIGFRCVHRLNVLSSEPESDTHVKVETVDTSSSQDECPDGFLNIPENENLGVSRFCVMKYEARKDRFGRAISKPDNLPWTNISLIEAKARCQALGRRYDLISNPQWVSIAQNVELVGKNWSEGEVGKGHFPKGWSGHSAWNTQWVSNLDPTTAPSTEDCKYNLEGSICSAQGDHVYRRTLYLDTGRKIWDFVGNTWNWVDWTTGGELELGPRDCPEQWRQVHEFNCPSLSIEDIGYTLSDITSSMGYGQVYGGRGGGALRGGPRPWFASGPFALSLSSMSDGAGDFFGFRCVWK